MNSLRLNSTVKEVINQVIEKYGAPETTENFNYYLEIETEFVDELGEPYITHRNYTKVEPYILDLPAQTLILKFARSGQLIGAKITTTL